MNTHDDLVSDYLRAVGRAMSGVSANRRDELLADLSQHIAAKRAELEPESETEADVRSILELLGDPAEVAAEAMIDAEPAPPITIQPGKKLGAMAWVLITAAAVATLCVGAILVGVLFFAAPSKSDTAPGVPAIPTRPSVEATSSVTPPSSSPT